MKERKKKEERATKEEDKGKGNKEAARGKKVEKITSKPRKRQRKAIEK